MRSPKVILENLQKHSNKEVYGYERLYRNLYNHDFYLQAYQNIYANKGAMTPGIDGITFDGLGNRRITQLINSLKNHSYQPNPVKRVYIPKKNGKKHPLGIASSDDKLVQEIIRMILESIYEPTFSNYSHGFRPTRSCHTALLQIQHNFTGIRWFIEGDIKAYFDTIDHHILIEILRRRIKDEAFIELIWKFLRAGYLEKWEYNATFSGVAQGSGFSPILANIYLNELDSYIEEYAKVFNQGKTRRHNNEYCQRQSTYQRYINAGRKIWDTISEDEKAERIKEAKRLKRDSQKYPSKKQMDDSYKRIQYTRYADDFLIGVIGLREDAERIKTDIKRYLQDKLKSELSDEKTLITSGKDKARFLSYDITVCKDAATKKTKRGQSRLYNDRIKLYVPKEKWFGKLLQYGVLKIINKRGEKEKWKPLQRDDYMYLKPSEMVLKYNEQIRGLYNYYCLANNVSVLNKFYYIMEYSLYKTIAGKYKITMTQAKLKYTKNKEFAVPYETVHGTKYAVLYNKGFTRVKKAYAGEVDIMPEYSHMYKPKEIFRRYNKCTCELCGKHTKNICIHQVGSMAELTEKTPWEYVMRKKKRKTLVVCEDCYDIIHIK
ncbi:MAG: reverse transcriptase domain-containing protein [Clostridiales bacterium]|nr:reverse transcriptase domain-containing protein [Clostridiales bacterium]